MKILILIALFLIGCRTQSPTKTYSTVIDIGYNDSSKTICDYFFNNRAHLIDSCGKYVIGDVVVFYKTK